MLACSFWARFPAQSLLSAGEYYAQPHNAFWRIMGELAGASPDLPYQDRLRSLKEHGIALWDVCAAGCRLGSLDSAIELSTVETNDIGEFLRAHAGIDLICFNGRKAKEIFDRKVRQEPAAPFRAHPLCRASLHQRRARRDALSRRSWQRWRHVLK